MTAYGMCSRPYLKEIAFSVLVELPEVRLLQKALRYLGQLPYSYHHEICRRLMCLLQKEQFGLPYHASLVLDTFRWLHPHDGGYGIGGKISNLVLRRKTPWTMRQKACDALMTLPYREDDIMAHAEKMLKDDHPFVRRAGCVLMTRCPVQWVREKVGSLLYHPDHSLGRLALMWNRHLTDRQAALSQLEILKKRKLHDDSVVRQLPWLWILRCSAEKEVVSSLRDHLKRLNQSKSGKVKWHKSQLLIATKWACAKEV